MVAVVLFLLLLALMISITVCCVFRKKREMWILQAQNGSYSDRNDGAMAEGTRENGGVSLREVVEGEVEAPEFDFDAVAGDGEMKVNSPMLN